MTVLLEYFDGPVYALLEGMILLSLSVNFSLTVNLIISY